MSQETINHIWKLIRKNDSSTFDKMKASVLPITQDDLTISFTLPLESLSLESSSPESPPLEFKGLRTNPLDDLFIEARRSHHSPLINIGFFLLKSDTASSSTTSVSLSQPVSSTISSSVAPKMTAEIKK